MSDRPTAARKAAPPRAWQRMLSGRRLDLLDPSPIDVEIEDIAHGLSRVARWNGQTTGAWGYSVAQHSVLVEFLITKLAPKATPEERMTALLHDAGEYVVGDMISPFKAALGYDYRELEDRLQSAIHIRFGLPPKTPERLKKLIKKADRASAYVEAISIAGFSVTEARQFWGRLPSPLESARLDATPEPPDEAKNAFLDRFQSLSTALGRE